MLSSLKLWVQIPWWPILQSKETGAIYYKSFPSQGLISQVARFEVRVDQNGTK